MSEKQHHSGRNTSSRRQSGFTIVELLAVTMVMAILAAIVLGIAGYAGKRSDDAKAASDLQSIRSALDEYRVKTGTYIVEEMVTHAAWEDVGYVLTNYVEKITFVDPWGNPYQYRPLRPSGQDQGRVLSYDLFSWGPTGDTEDYDIIK